MLEHPAISSIALSAAAVIFFFHKTLLFMFDRIFIECRTLDYHINNIL